MRKAGRGLLFGSLVASTTLGAVVAGAGVAGAAATKSTYKAGYEATETLGISTVGATFVVPKLRCPSTGSYSSYAEDSLGGGRTSIAGGIFVKLSCTSGVASYVGFLNAAGHTAKGFTVTGGDTLVTKIKVAIGATGSTMTMIVTNETTGVTTRKAATTPTIGLDTDAFFGVTDFLGTPVPPFGSIGWSNCTVNSATLASTAPTRYVMTNGSETTTLVGTSALATTGEAFTNKFLASS